MERTRPRHSHLGSLPPSSSPSKASSMNWNDPFDFSSSCSHLSSPLIAPLSYSPYCYPASYLDQAPLDERDFCSNFTCCGTTLNDLHELVDHFEESHVGRAYNELPLDLSRPGTHETLQREALDLFSAVSDVPVSHIDGDEADSDAFDAASNDASPIVYQKGLPPSSFSPPPTPSRGPMRKLERRRQPMSRKREKMYRCPHSGCTKTYLNPNGLSYHLKKGTCKIEPSFGRYD